MREGFTFSTLQCSKGTSEFCHLMNARPHTHPTVYRKEKFVGQCMDSTDQIVKQVSVMAVDLIASLLHLTGLYVSKHGGVL
jgi:hypothetical protein